MNDETFFLFLTVSDIDEKKRTQESALKKEVKLKFEIYD